MFVSGLLRKEETLDLFTINSESGIPDPSGFNLYTSGRPTVQDSGLLDFFVHGKQIITTELTGGGSMAGGGGNLFGLGMRIGANEPDGTNSNASLTLNVLKPLSQEFVIGSMDYNGMIYGAGSFWNFLRANPFNLMLFNDHLAGDDPKASANSSSLNLFSVGEQKLESNFRVLNAPLFVSGSGTLISTGNMPLFLESNIVEPGSISGSVPLVIYNVHGGISSAGGGFNWDSYDYGVGIDDRDNIYSRLSLDNEIRGVNTVGYGACDNE